MTPETPRETVNGAAVYKVPESNIDALQSRVTKLNRRAVKLGMSLLVLAEHGEEFKTVERSISDDWMDDEGDKTRTRKFSST